jgi:hypothetical protein
MRIARAALAGLGQAAGEYTTAQVLTNPLNPYATPQTNADAIAEANASYQCNWFESFFWPSACASAATATPPVPTLPNGGSPTIASVDPVTGDVTMLTPQQQQAQNVASIQAQAVANAPADCTQLWNQLTNSACPFTYGSSAGSWLLIGGAAILGLWIFSKVTR